MAFPGFLSRFGGWPRRGLVALCLLLAAVSATSEHRVASGPTVAVVVATRAVPAGSRLAAADLVVARWPRAVRPASAFTSTSAVVGQRAAGALAAGEALTPARVLGSGLTTGLADGLAAVPVPLADAGSAALVHPGDRADLIVAPTTSGDPPRLAASGILVIAVLPATSGSSGSQPAELVVAADQAQELQLAAAAGRGVFASVRSPP